MPLTVSAWQTTSALGIHVKPAHNTRHRLRGARMPLPVSARQTTSAMAIHVKPAHNTRLRPRVAPQARIACVRRTTMEVLRVRPVRLAKFLQPAVPLSAIVKKIHAETESRKAMKNVKTETTSLVTVAARCAQWSLAGLVIVTCLLLMTKASWFLVPASPRGAAKPRWAAKSRWAATPPVQARICDVGITLSPNSERFPEEAI